MASTSPGYGITIRVEGSPALQPVALITAAITDAGATITALDVVESLLEKVAKNNSEEVIIALDTSTEGEATTLYLHRILSPICQKITRLAFGLPVGTELEYADELTLARAIEGRCVIY